MGVRWVLDFVGYAPRHFTPGCHPLRLFKVGEVVKHHHPAHEVLLLILQNGGLDEQHHGTITKHDLDLLFQMELARHPV